MSSTSPIVDLQGRAVPAEQGNLSKIGWMRGKSLLLKVVGVLIFMGAWQLGGQWVANNPDTKNFADFAPAQTLSALKGLIASGSLIENTVPSLKRIGIGIFIALLIGIPLGVAIGRFSVMNDCTYLPFQFLRMVSPLAWMPIAVMIYPGWDSAIVFLITMAAVWPLILSSAAGVKRIDPSWLTVARNLGASELQVITKVILPSVLYDILNGLRLAIGVAWVVIVPAEFLGVSSGLGYAINDARDTLEYDTLAAYVIAIGFIGYTLDSSCAFLNKKLNWTGEA